mmetsp:Transcript_87241/g.244839  ORF Transcript_87241/g.244839 Transcript_87241/m.244839 type:complete len:275 (+) Transcript_87241:289-1113(+)
MSDVEAPAYGRRHPEMVAAPRQHDSHNPAIPQRVHEVQPRDRVLRGGARSESLKHLPNVVQNTKKRVWVDAVAAQRPDLRDVGRRLRAHYEPDRRRCGCRIGKFGLRMEPGDKIGHQGRHRTPNKTSNADPNSIPHIASHRRKLGCQPIQYASQTRQETQWPIHHKRALPRDDREHLVRPVADPGTCCRFRPASGRFLQGECEDSTYRTAAHARELAAPCVEVLTDVLHHSKLPKHIGACARQDHRDVIVSPLFASGRVGFQAQKAQQEFGKRV